MTTTYTPPYPFHPIAEEYPLLSGDELEALAQDIKQNGQIMPILLWSNQIIDGRNRYLACRIAGVTPKFDEVIVAEADLPNLIESLNEHRRMLTPDFLAKKRADRLDRIAKARDAGKSLRVIAETENISVSQVRRDLDDVVRSDLEYARPEPDHVVGRDGKTYSAKQDSLPFDPDPPRQPGDDTEEEQSAIQADKSRGKNGSQFNWIEFDSAWGKLLRQIDALGNLYGCSPGGTPHKDSTQATALREILIGFKTGFKAWEKDLQKGK